MAAPRRRRCAATSMNGIGGGWYANSWDARRSALPSANDGARAFSLAGATTVGRVRDSASQFQDLPQPPRRSRPERRPSAPHAGTQAIPSATARRGRPTNGAWNSCRRAGSRSTPVTCRVKRSPVTYLPRVATVTLRALNGVSQLVLMCARRPMPYGIAEGRCLHALRQRLRVAAARRRYPNP